MSKQVMNIRQSSLSGNLARGFIALPLGQWRTLTTNDIGSVNATDGGALAKNSDPIYERVNAATDKRGRIKWAAASILEIHGPEIVYPPDLDDAAPITVNLLASMAAASVDVPVIAIGFFEGIGDTNAGGNTSALSTALQHLTFDIAAADVGAYPKGASITLKPGVHATASNDVNLYGCWLTYTRRA